MNTKIVFFTVFQMIGVAGFSQSLSLQYFGESFQCTNLEVRWQATNALPRAVWIYRLSPITYTPQAISNLMVLGGFTAKDLNKSGAEAVIYANADKFPSKYLMIADGNIEYEHHIKHSPTNLAEGVPEWSQIPQLTTNFLANIGFNISELKTNSDGTPAFGFIQPLTKYYLPDRIVTNVEYREVSFGRTVDGARFVSIGTGGDGTIDFGEHSNIVKVDVSWKDLKRYKSYPAATPATIIQWIREGKAVQGGVPMTVGSIDWPNVKTLTVRKAELYYYAGERLTPSDWLMPLISLWTTVDTVRGPVDVGIYCPIIDETALLEKDK